MWNGVPVSLDATDMDPDRDPVAEVVAFLVSFGFLDQRALDEAGAYLDKPSSWRPGRPPRRLRRVLEIIEHLQPAGGQ